MMTQRLKFPTAWHLFVIALVLGAFVLPSSAQNTSGVVSQPFSPGPYRVGERLTFNVSFSNFISAAHVELLVAARGTFLGREGIQLKGHVETTGIVNAALFAINNDYITYVDSATGLPFHAQQIVRAASRSSDTSAEFNQSAGALPKETREFPGTYDLLSAIYHIRALPLSDDANYTLSVRSESETYQVEVKVKGRQIIRTNAGSFDTIVTQVGIRNSSGGNDYGIRVFFTNDQRHVPVLITAKLSAGEIRAELAGSEFISSPTHAPAQSPTPMPDPSTPNSVAGTDPALQRVPFKVGEQLNYQVYLPSIAAPVGRATFQVRARSKYFNQDGLWFTVSAQTTNALQSLFVANEVISSYVDPETLLPFQTELNLSEGRTRVNTKLVMKQDYGRATTEKGERIDIPIGTHDYLSYFYVLQTFSLTLNKATALSILVNNKPKTLTFTPLKRETVQLGSQTIPAIQVSLTTDDAQPDKFQLRGWISDDRRRLPLRLTAVTKLGAIRADLAIIPVVSQ